MVKRGSIIYLSVFFLLFLIPACNNTTEPEYNAKSFFPLQKGNTWTYFNTSSGSAAAYNTKWEVTGTIMKSGNIFYTITVTGKTPDDTLYYRCSGDTLFTLNKYNNEETVIADFSLNKGDTCWWNHDYVVMEKSKDVMTFGFRKSIDSGYEISFKRFTGITSTETYGFVYYESRLIDAHIK
jgi:hypothetical protein